MGLLLRLDRRLRRRLRFLKTYFTINLCFYREVCSLLDSARLACWSTPSRFRLRNQLRGAQRKAAPCPRIMGLSPQSGVVHTRDVFREGSRVLASEARARANERERVRGSQFTRTKQQVQLQDMRTYNKYMFI